jgi:hypothetical protein
MQPIGELLNQAATIERMMDALGWVEERLSPTVAVSANPTTSSNGADITVETDRTWYFEVCDVASPSNTNRKLDKDLSTMARIRSNDPDGRFFLAVSPEWVKWLAGQRQAFWTRRRWNLPHRDSIHRAVGDAETGVVELHPADDPRIGHIRMASK